MRITWIILSLVFGLLFFALGCAVDSTIAEGLGACLLLAGVVPLMERVWPEEVGV